MGNKESKGAYGATLVSGRMGLPIGSPDNRKSSIYTCNCEGSAGTFMNPCAKTGYTHGDAVLASMYNNPYP